MVCICTSLHHFAQSISKCRTCIINPQNSESMSKEYIDYIGTMLGKKELMRPHSLIIMTCHIFLQDRIPLHGV